MLRLLLSRMGPDQRRVAEQVGQVHGDVVVLTDDGYVRVLNAPRRVRVADLVRVAAERRPGFMEAWMAAGRSDGEFLEVSASDCAGLQDRFGGVEAALQTGCRGCGN